MMKSTVLADSPGNIPFLPPIVNLPKVIDKYHPTKLVNLLTYYHQTLAIHSDRKLRKGYTIIILNSNSQLLIIITYYHNHSLSLLLPNNYPHHSHRFHSSLSFRKFHEVSPIITQHYLVGGIPTPLKNMSSSVGVMKFPIYGKS